jgi:hypothetical protein
MRTILHLTGVTGLVMHNPQMADPDNAFVKAISELNGKKSRKTDADRAEIERLEWYGGIYHDAEIGPYLPTWNLVKSLERAATLTRQGSTVIRAVAVTTEKVAVAYDGPRQLDPLWERAEHRFRAIVGVQRNRVPRMRPIFRRWKLEVELEMMEDVLNPDEFERIVHQAGRSEGLGDARKLGYGRFMAEVVS